MKEKNENKKPYKPDCSITGHDKQIIPGSTGNGRKWQCLRCSATGYYPWTCQKCGYMNAGHLPYCINC